MKAFVKVVDVLDSAEKFEEAVRFQKQMVDYVSAGSGWFTQQMPRPVHWCYYR
jgi:hypothetical protein